MVKNPRPNQHQALPQPPIHHPALPNPARKSLIPARPRLPKSAPKSANHPPKRLQKRAVISSYEKGRGGWVSSGGKGRVSWQVDEGKRRRKSEIKDGTNERACGLIEKSHPETGTRQLIAHKNSGCFPPNLAWTKPQKWYKKPKTRVSRRNKNTEHHQPPENHRTNKTNPCHNEC